MVNKIGKLATDTGNAVCAVAQQQGLVCPVCLVQYWIPDSMYQVPNIGYQQWLLVCGWCQPWLVCPVGWVEYQGFYFGYLSARLVYPPQPISTNRLVAIFVYDLLILPICKVLKIPVCIYNKTPNKHTYTYICKHMFNHVI